MPKPREKDKDDDRDKGKAGKDKDRPKETTPPGVEGKGGDTAVAAGEGSGKRKRSPRPPKTGSTGTETEPVEGQGQSPPPDKVGPGPAPSPLPGDAGARIAAEAGKYIGFAYVHGTQGPGSFDCSGLVCWVVRQVTGQSISPDSHVQFTLGTAVDRSQLQPGDLLFYDTQDGGEVRAGNAASHVGIYVGPGRMVNALTEDEGVVVRDPFSSYFAPLFLGARRLG